MDWVFLRQSLNHKTSLLGGTQIFPSSNIFYFFGRVNDELGNV